MNSREALLKKGELSCQIAVVGSGPGGAISAALLAESGKEVILIEEGQALTANSAPAFSLQEMEQKYRSGGLTVAIGKPKIAYVEGSVVGGGSEVNSGLYHRLPAEILEEWRRNFLLNCSKAELEKYYTINEKELSVGYLPHPAPKASLILEKGAKTLGYQAIEIPRLFKYQSPQQNTGSGIKQAMSVSYIPRFIKAGGYLLSAARVKRLKKDISAWQLDVHCQENQNLKIRAETVFLCAGAIQTPTLLLNSGIRQNIGQNLQLHPTIKVTAKFQEQINAPGMGVPVHQVKEFAPDFSFGCSISSLSYLALALAEQKDLLPSLPTNWQKMAIYYAMIKPEGKGKITKFKRYNDPLVSYKLTKRDQQLIAKSLRELCRLLLAAGAAELFPSVSKMPPLKNGQEITKIPNILPAKDTNLMTIHLFSSCPMGEKKAITATDSYGQLHEEKGLYINDASLLCSAPAVNPQGALMAIARRNIAHFLQR